MLLSLLLLLPSSPPVVSNSFAAVHSFISPTSLDAVRNCALANCRSFPPISFSRAFDVLQQILASACAPGSTTCRIQNETRCSLSPAAS